ncbi:hypothetical protein MHH81_12790 [Psychrobacillus sp. FSL H8-0484]|uniref:hypothetical protein n=1 Tax=Psychrobacillus sp. FSL H8-0484 TaxID=2921390 RepID=UPI0030F5DE55
MALLNYIVVIDNIRLLSADEPTSLLGLVCGVSSSSYWTQHVVQVLQMFVHLGILSIFVGGASQYPDTPWRLVPEIYKLSGMISISWEVFMTKQFWMILPPLFVFMLLIYCFHTIAEGIASNSSSSLLKKKQKRERAIVNNWEEQETVPSHDYSRISDAVSIKEE